MSAGISRLSVGCPNTITRSMRSPKFAVSSSSRYAATRFGPKRAPLVTSASSGAPSARAASSACSPAPVPATTTVPGAARSTTGSADAGAGAQLPGSMSGSGAAPESGSRNARFRCTGPAMSRSASATSSAAPVSTGSPALGAGTSQPREVATSNIPG